MESSTIRFPSEEQPDPLLFVLLMRVFRRRLFDVGGLIDDHRGVARAHAEGRLAGAVGCLHHGCAARGDGKIAERHELLSQRNAGLFDTLHEILGGPLLLEGSPQNSGSFSRSLAGRMRREDDSVPALERIDHYGDHGDHGIGHRQQTGNHPCGFRVLGDPLFRNLLDNPMLFARRASRRIPNTLKRLVASRSPCRSHPLPFS